MTWITTLVQASRVLCAPLTLMISCALELATGIATSPLAKRGQNHGMVGRFCKPQLSGLVNIKRTTKMKKIIPNKPLSYKILCGAVMLTFCLAAPGDSLRHPPLGGDGIFCLVYGCSSCAFTPVKRELERGLAIGIGRTKTTARAAARKFIPKDGRLYGAPVYIKNSNNTYTCYLKWKWSTTSVSLPAK